MKIVAFECVHQLRRTGCASVGVATGRGGLSRPGVSYIQDAQFYWLNQILL